MPGNFQPASNTADSPATQQAQQVQQRRFSYRQAATTKNRPPLAAVGLGFAALLVGASVLAPVLLQDPEPDSAEAISGPRVTILSPVATTIAPMVRIPSVVAKPTVEATNLLTAAGITVGDVTTVADVAVPEGHVVAVVVNGELVNELRFGSTADLQVSSGAPLITVPLVNGPQQEVLRQLQSIGLIQVVVSTEHSQMTRGEVISIVPQPGSAVKPDTKISLVVSLGPETAPTTTTTAPPVKPVPVPVTATPLPAVPPVTPAPQPTTTAPPVVPPTPKPTVLPAAGVS